MLLRTFYVTDKMLQKLSEVFFLHPTRRIGSASAAWRGIFQKEILIMYPLENEKSGMVEPVAETAQAIVTSLPLSADVRKPTCLYPFRPTILSGFWAVVTPFSSMLYMSFSWNLLQDRTVRRLSKKALTGARLVVSGVLIDRVGCRLRMAVNQSTQVC